MLSGLTALPELMHMTPSYGTDRTRCCGELVHLVPRNHQLTSDAALVTCKGYDPDEGDLDRIIARRQALIGRSNGAFGRLMDLRARLIEASTSAISPAFREELLEFIDRG